MGSSGQHSFGDYHPPSDGKTRCDNSIDTALEDVARLSYFLATQNVPPVGTPVEISPKLLANRVVVVETQSGRAIGNLPVTFNYIPICQQKGYSYAGQVTGSRKTPIPAVEVHIDPL